jgi:hypothetical protein
LAAALADDFAHTDDAVAQDKHASADKAIDG